MELSLVRNKDLTTPQVLRITEGTHRDATFTCEEGGVVLLGSAADCDIILSDTGVSPHHCLVTACGGRYVVRALDVAVKIKDKVVAPGRPITVMAFKPVQIASGVSFVLGPEDSPRWERMNSKAAVLPVTANDEHTGISRSTRTVLAAVSVLGLGAAFAALAFRPDPPAPPEPERLSVSSVLDSLALSEVQVGTRDGGTSVQLLGVVPDKASLEQLRKTLEQAGIPAEFEIRSGQDIAGDVREILRMSGIGAQTRYLGLGRVEVRGQFADEEQLAEVINSRAIRDVESLGTVVVVNDHAAIESAEDSGIQPGKKIVSVVRGADPYVITADGSRYYVGAQLPGGGKLQSITEQHIWVDTGEEIRKLDPDDTHVKRSSN